VRGRTDSNDVDTKVNNDLDGANIAPDRINLYAAYARGPLDARVAARFYLERQFNDAAIVTDFEGYTLVDASAGYRFGKHRISLSAMNVLDKYYVSYNSDTVSATDPARFFAGRGRALTLGVTSEF
jgi:iron complex outermembrane receptor protein